MTNDRKLFFDVSNYLEDVETLDDVDTEDDVDPNFSFFFTFSNHENFKYQKINTALLQFYPSF